MFDALKKLFPAKADSALPQRLSTQYKVRGDAHLNRGEFEDAIRCYRQAITTGEDTAEVHVNLGFVLKEQRNYKEAEASFRQALAIDPKTVDAHYMLGSLAKEQNDLELAITHFSRALEVKPDFEFAYRDLCLAHFQSGQIASAKDVISRGIIAFPKSAEFQLYLGNLYAHEDDTENAATCYRNGLSIQPEFPELLSNLGTVLRRQNKIEEALACYEKSLAINPNYARGHVNAGDMHYRQGRLGAALAHYQQAIALDPDLGETHLVATLSGENPERAPNRYVEDLFDDLADQFDSLLVQKLSYNVPQQLVDLVTRSFDSTVGKWNILDLGCGTGLVGAAISPFAGHLVGVDLSGKMLAKARMRNLYHRLDQADLLPMLQGESEDGYDVVIAADVFVYVGRLDDLFVETLRVLRPGGLFAFSVEADENESIGESDGNQVGYRLTDTGRYAHTSAYIHRLAIDNNFHVVEWKQTQGRINKGKPVQAYLAILRR